MGDIEYCDRPYWNPAPGCDGVGCAVKEVCWAKLQAKRRKPQPNGRGCQLCYDFVPHLHPERLSQPLKRKKPARICTNFMGEILSNREVTEAIFGIIRKCPQHTFVCLTKRPENLAGLEIPENVWMGVTVNTQADVLRIHQLLISEASTCWVSFEPLLEPIEWSSYGLDWVVIGAQTRPNKQPEKAWVQDILDESSKYYDIPVFMKNNLEWDNPRKEYPTKQPEAFG